MDFAAAAITNVPEWDVIVKHLREKAQYYLEAAAEAPDVQTQHYYRGCWHSCNAMIGLPRELEERAQPQRRELPPRVTEIPRGY